MLRTKSIQKQPIDKKTKNINYTYSNLEPLVKSTIFGVGLTNATNEEVLEYLFKIIKNTKKNIYVVTPNPEILLFSQQHSDFKKVLNSADLALCDGMQLYRAARFLGKPLKERIIGTDFVEKLCEKIKDWPITVGFLGGGPKVAEKTAECLKTKFPGLKVVFTGTECKEESEVTKNLEDGRWKIDDRKIDILFVAFGAPKQEFWMAQHINKIPVRVMIGVGGAFDQIVHPSLRPPAWMHAVGFGWFYRLIREPWRVGRQIKLVKFILLVLKEKFLEN